MFTEKRSMQVYYSVLLITLALTPFFQIPPSRSRRPSQTPGTFPPQTPNPRDPLPPR
jgi:hypothetical protein